MSLAPLASLLALLPVQPQVSGEAAATAAVAGTWSGVAADNDAPPYALDFDGTDFVIVWLDARAHALMASRVSASGQVLEPANVVLRGPLHDALLTSEGVALAFDGAQHLVVFSTTDARTSVVRLVALRLAPDLSLIDPTPIVITQASVSTPTATFDGTRFVVGWSQTANERRVARIASNGVVLDPSGIQVDSGGTAGASVGRMAVASAGGLTAVVWQATTQVAGVSSVRARARRLRGDGSWLDPAPLDLGNAGRYAALPNVATNGNEWLLAWNEGQFAGAVSYQAFAARLGVAGPPSTPVALLGGANELSTAGPAVSWTGTEWHLVYALLDAARTVRGVRVSAAGAPVGAVVLPALAAPRYPGLVSDGQRELWVAVSQEGLGRRTLRAFRVDGTLSSIDPQAIEISRAAPAQTAVVAAAGVSGGLLAWHQGTGAWPLDVRVARIDALGQSIDPTGIEVAPGVYSGGGFTVLDAAFDGTNFLVAWIGRSAANPSDDDVYAARVAPSGQVLDPGGFPVAVRPSTQYDVTVAGLPTGRSLVCWRESAPGRVRCARVDSNGQIVDLNGGIDVSRETTASVAVTTIGGQFFVAWTTPSSGAPGTLKLCAVDPATGAPGPVQTVATTAYWPGRPAFGGSATEGLLMWSDASAGGTRQALLMATVDAVGQRGAVSTVAPQGRDPSVARQGLEWLLSWDTDGAPSLLGATLWGRRWSAGGFLDAPFELAAGFGLRRSAILPTSGAWSVSYARFVEDEPTVHNVRVRTRQVGMTISTPDGGLQDAGPDGGSPDASLDGGAITPDGGVSPDGDIGAADGGVSPDGGALGPDAMSEVDAGAEIADGGAVGGLQFISTPPKKASCDTPYDYAARAESSRGSTISYALTESPEGMTIDETGRVRFTPARDVDRAVVEVLASDGLSTVRQLYTLEVSCDLVSVASDGCDCTTTSAPGEGSALLGALALAGWIVRRRTAPPRLRHRSSR